jgi:type I restriction enzyme S subunit
MSTATLHNEKTKTLVPQLRFQEFDEEWKLKNLEEISKWASGGTPPKDNPLFWDGDIPWISASSMRGIVYSDSELKITNAGLKKGSKLARKGSLLILVRGSMLFNKIPIGIVSKDVSFNQDVKSIVVDSNYSTSEFILNWFTAFETKILNMVTGTGIGAGKLDLPDLKALKISLPTLPEQQKIASFLSAVDEKIQQLTRKVTLLEQYKKGVMQQLFSGKLRFKDENGKDYPDWEEKRLGNLTFKVGKKNKENIQYPIYSINNKEGFLPQSEQFDGLDSNDRGYDISLYKIVESETFAYNPARINVGSIGYSYDLKKVIVSSLYVCFKTVDILEDLYLLAYLDTYNFKKDILRFEEGGVRQYLFYENFSLIKIPLPSNKEQQKIANFLSGIDSKIEKVNQQLAQTQTFKKGLLQQMFV